MKRVLARGVVHPKTTNVVFRLTTEEKRTLATAAAREGKSLSMWLLELGLRRAAKVP